jgi:predicted membrane-bound spermidine synthase
VAFPVAILPLLGVDRAALVFGALNLAVASLAKGMFWEELPQRRRLAVLNALAWFAILSGLFAADRAVPPLRAQLGDWGFVMAIPGDLDASALPVPDGSRYLTPDVYRHALVFPPDTAELDTELNDLDRPVLIRYHEAGWSAWNE